MPNHSDGQQFSNNLEIGQIAEDLPKTDNPEPIDLSQVYVLIDSILPFEACLYYQVLPLYIEGSRLVIGMVNSDDQVASDYVKKQLSYINYSITFRAIPSDWHRDLLSLYLSHNAKSRQSPPSQPAPAPPKKATPPRQKFPPSTDRDRDLQATFIVDQPDQLSDIEANEALVSDHLQSSPAGPVPSRATPEPSTPAAQSTTPAPTSPDSVPPPAPPGTAPPLHLQIDERYGNIDDTQLGALPPKALMQALLSKVLEEGIGRLYFERREQSGRILWSRDGILQAVVESIDLSVFQGVINEFKLLTHLSLIAVKKPRQVEIERLYNGQRLLLRFRIMPNAYGEEATLQVLRGTALRFYQQQQIDKLGRDALDAAQILQRRLGEIRDRARETLNFRPTRSETLPAIIQLLRQMEAQVNEIVSAYDLREEDRHNQAEDDSK